MKNLVILGAGTGGTMMANHLVRKLDRKNWKITVIDKETTHYYQAGFLLMPFGIYNRAKVTKPISGFLPKKVDHIQEEAELINHAENKVLLKSGKEIAYDILIIATGCDIVPSEVEGMLGSGWRKNIFDFYTADGSEALAAKLAEWDGGNLVVHITETPVKCPVAPLEFAFLADWYMTKKGKRDKTNITFVTPQSDVFTKKKTSEILDPLLKKKNINIVTDFAIESVDSEASKIRSYDEKEVSYDLLVTVPTNMGDELIERSGLGDETNFVPTDKHTLQAKGHENIFVIGDASDLPASKAGSVAHSQSEILTENILRFIEGKELLPEFDGHSNCFIESGFGKGFLIDFNYEIEPVPGTFPVPGLGPFALLKETRLNHLGKLVMRYLYWYIIIKGIKIPFMTSKMNLKGKKL